MPLTAFGIFCRNQRIRMRSVTADQSAATGFSCSFISAVECGANAPDDYLAKVIQWMQLDEAEATELTLLAKLKPRNFAKRALAGSVEETNGDLVQILHQITIAKAPASDGPVNA